jgi:hypothetical protein
VKIICTPCGDEVPDGKAAIYGIERDGKWAFGWTCCHQPVSDVTVAFGSTECLAQWITEHPEHEAEILKLLEGHEHARQPQGS